jgi:hypothetical protein
MRTRHWFVGIVCASGISWAIVAAIGVPRVAAQSTEMNVKCGAQPCETVIKGWRAFNDRRLRGLGGNGRSCADCHMPSEAFQLSPAAARARFMALIGPGILKPTTRCSGRSTPTTSVRMANTRAAIRTWSGSFA